MKRSIYQGILAATAVLIFSGCAFADASAVVSLQPTSSTISTGDIATVDVDISGVSDLYAYQFDVLFGAATVSLRRRTRAVSCSAAGQRFSFPAPLTTSGEVSPRPPTP